MQQIADEVFFDGEIALVNIGDPREYVHVLDQLALRVVANLAVFVAVGKAGDGFQRAVFGDFLAGEIEFFAPDPIDGP